LSKEILKARTQVEQDANTNYILVGEQYKKDEATFEEFNEASSTFHQAQEGRIKFEFEVQIARIHLEEIIGLRWEQVQHTQKD
jgi:outer membrane protein TolC